MSLRERIAQAPSAARAQISDIAASTRTRLSAARQRARELKDEWQERWYRRNHPSTAQDPQIKDAEDAFYQAAKSVVGHISAIEHAQRELGSEMPPREFLSTGSMREERRMHRDTIRQSTSDARREFPFLREQFATTIRQSSVPEVALQSSAMVDSIDLYLRNRFDGQFHPEDALTRLHAAMFDQCPLVSAEDDDAADTDSATSDSELTDARADDEAPSEAEPAAAVLLARRMRDPEYRRHQHSLVYIDRLAPINQLVDALRSEQGEWMPYVAPTYGGIEARILAVFRDPGPRTQQDKGSGFLSLENDDPSAERHLGFVTDAGISPTELTVWNTYPWYINRNPASGEIDRGLDPLRRLIDLLPELQVVIAHGGAAQTAWLRFERKYPRVSSRLKVIKTYHTSQQALWTPNVEERERRQADIANAYAKAAALLD
ncbi:uracil-DNA glycosylase [Nocardia sp. NPDC057663]|uniref:uracil-DNA glycosylase n=1 Tax=Nocardia sp. NPDC057663 TaxID=3346201 RepID=UPI0036705C3C